MSRPESMKPIGTLSGGLDSGPVMQWPISSGSRLPMQFEERSVVNRWDKKRADIYNKGFDQKETREEYPNGIDSKTPGSKLDSGKSPILQGCVQYFPRALEEVARVSLVGANKYSWKGWESVPNGVNRYGDALCRHLLAEAVQGDYDSGPGGTGLRHASQVAWNALARLELILRKEENG